MHKALCKFLLYQDTEGNKGERGEKEDREG